MRRKENSGAHRAYFENRQTTAELTAHNPLAASGVANEHDRQAAPGVGVRACKLSEKSTKNDARAFPPESSAGPCQACSAARHPATIPRRAQNDGTSQECAGAAARV